MKVSEPSPIFNYLTIFLIFGSLYNSKFLLPKVLQEKKDKIYILQTRKEKLQQEKDLK